MNIATEWEGQEGLPCLMNNYMHTHLHLVVRDTSCFKHEYTDTLTPHSNVIFQSEIACVFAFLDASQDQQLTSYMYHILQNSGGEKLWQLSVNCQSFPALKGNGALETLLL